MNAIDFFSFNYGNGELWKITYDKPWAIHNRIFCKKITSSQIGFYLFKF